MSLHVQFPQNVLTDSTVGDVREVQCTVRFRQEAQGVMVDQWCDIVWVRVTQWEFCWVMTVSIGPKSQVIAGFII